MNLLDGLTQYQTATIYYDWASKLEKDAENVLNLINQYGDNPTKLALNKAYEFILDVEKWKAGCLQQRMGNACLNTELEVWNAIYSAAQSTIDTDMLLSIMTLKGFGSSRDDETRQRRAKVATSVLRFLWPKKWGVVDWRIAAMLGFIKKNDWNIQKALNEAKERQANDFRDAFSLIDERGATEYNKDYRKISSQQTDESLQRAADIDMAIFGLSLLAWPMP